MLSRSPIRSLALLALSTLAILDGCGRASTAAEAKTEDTPPAGIRIASRTVLADEVLWDLGPEVRGRVLAVSPMADDARYSLVADRWPQAAPRLGQNPEELLALGPGLVILASFSNVEYRAAIEGKVELLVLDDFSGFAGYRENLSRIGAAVGAPEAAAALREDFDRELAAIEARRPPLAAGEERPDIVAWSYGNVAGAHTSFDDAATAAGFRNRAALEGIDGHRNLGHEQLVAWNPRWLVIGCGELSCDEARAALAAEPGLGHLAAIEEGRVIAVPPPYLGTVGAGLLELARKLQAPLLAEANTKAEASPP